MAMKMLRTLTLLGIAHCAGLLFASDAHPPIKVWSVDLNADSQFHRRTAHSEVLLASPQLDFLNSSTLICGFYDSETFGFEPRPERKAFHVLEISLSTGSLGRRVDFFAHNDRSRTMAVGDGKFVVLSGDELVEFNSDLESLSRFPTPIRGNANMPDFWLIDLAPGQKVVDLYNRNGENSSQFKWLAVNGLRELATIPAKTHWTIRGATDAIITDEVRNRILIRRNGTQTPICSECDAHFLSDDLVFVVKHKRYSISTLSGRENNRGKLDGDAADFARSAKSTRFAYLTGHYRGSGFPIQTHFSQISGSIWVRDWTSTKPISEIDVNEPVANPSAGLSQSALALSPDGKYLAVLLHHTLTLYRLP